MLLSSLGSGGIKSIQRGTAEVSTTTLNITISTVDMSKSVVIIDKSQIVGGPSGSISGGVCSYITSSTNLRIESLGSTILQKLAWQVVEYR